MFVPPPHAVTATLPTLNVAAKFDSTPFQYPTSSSARVANPAPFRDTTDSSHPLAGNSAVPHRAPPNSVAIGAPAQLNPQIGAFERGPNAVASTRSGSSGKPGLRRHLFETALYGAIGLGVGTAVALGMKSAE